MKGFLKVLSYIIAAIYPVLVFTFLVVFKLPVRILSLFIVVLAAAFLFSTTGAHKTGDKDKKKVMDWKPLLSSGLFLAAGFFCFITQKTIFLKLYSVVISVTLLFVFGGSLFFPPNIIFRFALLGDKSVKGSVFSSNVENYCKKVCVVWCAFFIINGSISVYTSLFASDRVWSIYNGGISYAVMGLLFAIEFIVRKQVDKKMLKLFPITNFTADSRKDDYVLCYEDTWSKGIHKTWLDFLTDTAKLRKQINESPADDWILHCEDYWYFLVIFTALLQCKKRILLTQNITENFIKEIRKEGIEFVTDQIVPDSRFIPDMVEKAGIPSKEEIRTTPEIVAEETRILLFTSGSTGKPKAVPQRMKEFNEDNAFVASKWRKEFENRKLVTTVSQHHIYGFLFGIALPFAIGIPFRRKRIELPDEFTRLSDESYMVIATPAFLKRTVEVESKLSIPDPWIFTSGGAVSPELAVQTNDVFGVYPLEVYGSTETSGIAYRQQNKDQLVWTPFDNAKVWKGDDGCLRIISPYIKDPEGFATADMVDFIEGTNRFIMKGRSDSIVKIEEKRISMTEIENRLYETKLVKDVKVIALSNEVRQFLAAAVVLNADGVEKFKDTEKYLVNRYFHDFLMKYFENVVLPKKWRFVDSLPTDVQGKVHKNEVAALFNGEKE